MALTGGLVLLAWGLAWALAAILLDRQGRRPPRTQAYDAIVVAGCRVRPDGRPSGALARRVRLAVELHRKGVAPRIVLTGGRIGAAPVSEARSAATLCEALGVPPADLVLEEASTNTLENAVFAGRLIRGEVLVVTDCAHTFRCRRMFARHFAHVDAVGVTGTRGPRARLALIEVGAVVRHGLCGRL